MVQYKAALVITGAIKGISRDIIYQEFGLESIADRGWSRRHTLMSLTMLLVKERI